MNHRFGLASIVCLFLAVSTAPAPAQVSDETLPAGNRIGQFSDARDLAVDDQGGVYVLDAETATVTLYTDRRRQQNALTAGSSGDAFSEPVDLDPTNGLRLIVADAGREQLQWYSRSFRLVETRRLIPASHRQSRRSGYGENGTATSAPGRPAAVASTVAGDLFAIDARDGVIYRWDASGRFGGILGRDGEGRLIDPVDLAAADELLYAADAGLRSIAVYDRYGSFVRLMANHQAADVRALSTDGDVLYLTLPDQILVYSLQGRLLRRLNVELDDPLVDCVRTDDALYLLTQTELLELPTR